ncbi:MAG: hypothetical protein IKP21_06840 [Bacteroidales bacterium]|nr:hypothetical protein [Bacteroidales bacterium]
MAKQTAGYMGGFSGKLGPAVGYMWNGRWCLRAHQPSVRNPRTAAQMAHRAMFKHQVQTASKLYGVLNKTMLALARENHMTVYNLFVSCNQHAFSEVDGVPTTDYSTLRLSLGEVAPVEEAQLTLTEHNVVNVRFGRGAGDWHDYVYMYVYVPELEAEFFSLPVYRGDRRVSAALPDSFAGCEAHVYLLVSDEEGGWAETVYAGCLNGGDEGGQESPTDAPNAMAGNSLQAGTTNGGGTAADHTATAAEIQATDNSKETGKTQARQLPPD